MKESISIRLLIAHAIALTVPCAPVLAAGPGALDTGFGTGGKVTTSFSESRDQVNSVALQSDGKIVVAGSSGDDAAFALARYTSNGNLDASFGTEGMTTTTVESSGNAAYGVVVQNDGKIVAAGDSSNGSRRAFALVRYSANGSLDTSFGSGGMVTTAIGSSDSYVRGVALQSDGKIVLAGYSNTGASDDFAVVRYNSNGTLDDSFDGDGIVTTSLGSGNDWAMSVAIQSDGKIVLAGESDNGTKINFALVRYNANGSLDTTFDSDGKVTTAIGSNDDGALSVVVQGDGRILTVGYSNNGSNDDVALARYNSNGSPDLTFNGTGKVTTAIGGANDRGNAVTMQSDGRILVAGFSFTTTIDFALLRYNSNGTLDTSFGDTGMVTTPIGTSLDASRAVALQNDGKIVLAGFSNGSSDYDFALARYHGTTEPEIAVEQPAGTNLTDNAVQINFGRVQVRGTRVERTFTVRNVSTAVLTGLEVGKNGTNAADFTVSALGATALEAGTSTTFTVAFAPDATGSRTAAIHIASNDADEDPFDISLAGTGIVPPTITTYQVLPCGTVGSAYSLPLQASGTAPFSWSVNAGSLPSPLGLTSAGVLGGTPAAAGVAHFTAQVTDNDGLTTTRAFDLKIMGPSEPGALDTSFGTGGKVLTPIGSSTDQGSGVALQGDGKIVVAGSYRNSDGNDDFAAVRYNTNGSLDTTFDSDGIATRLISSNNDRCQGVAVQADGKIVTAGYAQWTGPVGFTAVRFNANGSLDEGFLSGGRSVTPIGSAGDYGQSVAVQSDGKIVVAGYSNNGSNNDFALVRYNSDGSLDTSFDTDGTLTTAIGSADDAAYSVAIQSDGKIVAAGYSVTGTNYDFALVRYNSNGSLDGSFGSGGKVTTAIGSDNDVASALAVQADGKIVVVGYANNGGNSDFALARYNSNGTLDTSFGGGGKVTTAVGGAGDSAESVSILPSGKILVAGRTANGNSSDDVALALYQANGNLDTSFGYGGIVTTHAGTSSDRAMSMAVQSDGKVVVAGFTNNGSNDDFMVVRYVGITEPEVAVEQPEGTNLTDGSASVDWGYAEIGGAGSGRIFTVWNHGNANLTGLAVTVDGANAADFTVPYLGATSLAPGTSTTVYVDFHPHAAGSRTATVHLASNDSDENPFDIAVAGTGLSHLEMWRLVNFGSHLNSGNGADLTDYDHDGFANLLEYAFGGNPKVADGAAMRPTSGFSGDKFGISFKCDAIRTDITYTVQASSTLAASSWTDIARSVGGGTVVPVGSLSQVSDSGVGLRSATVTASPAVFPTGRGFLRIKVTE